MTDSQRRSVALRRNLQVVAALALAAIVVWAVASGAAGDFLEEDALRDRIRSWGVFGPIVFVVSMWAIQPFGVPGVLFMVPASVVWSDPVAILLSWIGNMGASWIAFEATRRVGRDWVAERIPDRLHRFDRKIAEGGVWPVFVLRLLTGQLPAADWLLGVSSVRRGPFLIGTGVGIIPGIVLTVLFGADVVGWLNEHRLVAFALIAVVLGRRAFRLLRSRRAAVAGDPTNG